MSDLTGAKPVGLRASKNGITSWQHCKNSAVGIPSLLTKSISLNLEENVIRGLICIIYTDWCGTFEKNVSCFWRGLGPSSVGEGEGDGTGDEVGVRNKSELERECCRGVSDSTVSELSGGTSLNKVISLS